MTNLRERVTQYANSKRVELRRTIRDIAVAAPIALALLGIAGCSGAINTDPSPARETPRILNLSYYSGANPDGSFIVKKDSFGQNKLLSSINVDYGDWSNNPTLKPYNDEFNQLLATPGLTTDVKNVLKAAKKKAIFLPDSANTRSACDVQEGGGAAACIVGKNIFIDLSYTKGKEHIFTHELIHAIIDAKPQKPSKAEILPGTKILVKNEGRGLPTLYLPTTTSPEDFKNSIAKEPFNPFSGNFDTLGEQNSIKIDGNNTKGYYKILPSTVAEIAASFFEDSSSTDSAYTQGIGAYDDIRKNLSKQPQLKGQLLNALYNHDVREILKTLALAHYGDGGKNKTSENNLILIGARDILYMTALTERAKDLKGLASSVYVKGRYLHYNENP